MINMNTGSGNPNLDAIRKAAMRDNKVTNTEFKAAVKEATKDNQVTKKELDVLKNMAMKDDKLNVTEQDSFYQIGLNGLCNFELKGNDKVETLISAGMLEKQGKWEDAVKLLEKSGLTEQADKIKEKHSTIAYNPVPGGGAWA